VAALKFLGSQPTHIGNSTVDFRNKKNKGQLVRSPCVARVRRPIMVVALDWEYDDIRKTYYANHGCCL
jgi:hypothetical protein